MQEPACKPYLAACEDIVQALRDGKSPEDIKELRRAPQLCLPWHIGVTGEEVEGVYSFPCFSQTFVDLFNAEIDNFYASKIPARRPNSMNNYGTLATALAPRCFVPVCPFHSWSKG